MHRPPACSASVSTSRNLRGAKLAKTRVAEFPARPVDRYQASRSDDIECRLNPSNKLCRSSLRLACVSARAKPIYWAGGGFDPIERLDSKTAVETPGAIAFMGQLPEAFARTCV